MLTEHNIIISVVRKTLPALRDTAYRDFIEVLRTLKIYDDRFHNRSMLTYTIGSNMIEFFSVDEAQKVRGRKRTYLWCNEMNEFTFEDWHQLILRTGKQAYGDYNPSEDYSWIYDKIQTRRDCIVIHSTYKDNPFLEPAIVKEIEYLKEIDDNYWRIYGLGLHGIPMSTIYTNWSLIDDMPEGVEKVYGQDFGFNNPSALIDVRIKDNDIYVDQKIYESKLNNSDLIARYDLLYISKTDIIYCDSAEPQRIDEIKKAGYWADSSNKDVTKGIDTLKSRHIYITKRSTKILEEIKKYKWKTKDDKILDEPVKMYDHAMDAIRYAVHTHLNKEYVGF